MSEVRAKKAEGRGLPGWVMTFADLMTLVLCFFVLLLSFSEMNVQKYKQVAGSMKNAFGVQREVNAAESPKGTSIIAKEFSPGRPTPTPLKVMRQNTTDESKHSVRFTDARIEQAKQLEKQLKQMLARQIREELIDVERQEGLVVIRIREKGSFPSGSAIMNRAFVPTLTSISKVLEVVEGEIRVAGHSDDIPISTQIYRSNWDLSSARAVSVVHVLLDNERLDPGKITAEGHADAHPLVPNRDRDSRALNRRVEIMIASSAALEEELQQMPDLGGGR